MFLEKCFKNLIVVLRVFCTALCTVLSVYFLHGPFCHCALNLETDVKLFYLKYTSILQQIVSFVVGSASLLL